MGFYLKKNNAASKVATVGGIDNSTDPVTFAVTTGEGSKFPASNFLISIDNEILLCTSRTGDNLTCARAKESTTIAAHSQNADVESRITAGTLAEYELLLLGMPRGTMLNGKIVPSVGTNHLTVAIKGLDGNDPSTTNPVYVRIGDTVRSITAALSVTKNAGTNWFNSGSTVLATKEVDYFVYLGYNTTDGVVVGFSRIPSGSEYDSFSASSTAGKYCAISTITNAAAGDDYQLVGRFAATLSAGAGYTWTVPTFTNKNLIQYPVFETRVLEANPILGWGGGTPPSGTPTVVYSKYKFTGDVMDFLSGGYAYTAGSGNTSLSIDTPIDALWFGEGEGSIWAAFGSGKVLSALFKYSGNAKVDMWVSSTAATGYACRVKYQF